MSMTPSIRRKLEALVERHEEVGRLLSDPDTLADNARFRELSKEYARLEPVASGLAARDAAARALAGAEAMRGDPEMADLAELEIAEQGEKLAALERQLQVQLLPVDPRDAANLFLEIRAGTGGDEAAIFSGDLFRMYSRYAERRG